MKPYPMPIREKLASFNFRPIIRLLVGLSLIALAWLYWLAADVSAQHIIGRIHDDGVYTVLAKSLAEGKGFILAHLPNQPYQSKYPILFPALLSVLWKCWPQFPQNITLLVGACWLIALSTLVVLYRYLRQAQQWSRLLAIGTVWAVGSNFYFIFYGNALMSEGLYTLLSIFLVWQADLYCRNDSHNHGRRQLLTVVGLSILLFHTRVIGLTLIAAIGVVLLLKRRWRDAMAYGALTASLTVLPWALWCAWANQANAHLWLNTGLKVAYTNYGQELWLNSHGLSRLLNQWSSAFQHELFRITEALLPWFWNFFKVMGQDEYGFPEINKSHLILNLSAAYGVLFLLLLRAVAAFRNRQLSVWGVYLFFYLICILSWGYNFHQSRFLCVITPWLWLTLLSPWSVPNKPLPRWQKPAERILAAALILVCLFPSAPTAFRNIIHMRQRHVVAVGEKAEAIWADYQSIFQQIGQLEKQQQMKRSDILVSAWDDAGIYLYTGHPVYFINNELSSTSQSPQIRKALYEEWCRLNIRWIFLEPLALQHEYKMPFNPLLETTLGEHKSQFKTIAKGPKDNVLLVQRLTTKTHP